MIITVTIMIFIAVIVIQQQNDCNIFHYVPKIDTLKNYLIKKEEWANCNLSSDSNGILRDY